MSSHSALVERMKRWGMVLLAGLVVFAAGAAIMAVGGDTVRDSTALTVLFAVLVMAGALTALLGGWLVWEEHKVDRDHGVSVGQVGKQTLGYTGGWAEHSIALAPKK